MLRRRTMYCSKSNRPTQPVICRRCQRDCKFAGKRRSYKKKAVVGDSRCNETVLCQAGGGLG